MTEGEKDKKSAEYWADTLAQLAETGKFDISIGTSILEEFAADEQVEILEAAAKKILAKETANASNLLEKAIFYSMLVKAELANGTSIDKIKRNLSGLGLSNLVIVEAIHLANTEKNKSIDEVELSRIRAKRKKQ